MRRLLLVLVVVLVNLPAVHQEWTEHRIDSSGRDVRATLVDARSDGGRNLVDYRLPAEIDPERRVFSARLDDVAYRAAVAAERLDVRVIPGKPGANRAEGEVESSLLLAAALGADVILVVVALLFRHRRRRRSENGPDLYDLA